MGPGSERWSSGGELSGVVLAVASHPSAPHRPPPRIPSQAWLAVFRSPKKFAVSTRLAAATRSCLPANDLIEPLRETLDPAQTAQRAQSHAVFVSRCPLRQRLLDDMNAQPRPGLAEKPCLQLQAFSGTRCICRSFLTFTGLIGAGA